MSVTLSNGKPPAVKGEGMALPSLLEFHSPTAALTVAPVRGSAKGTVWVVVALIAACFAAGGLIPIDKVVSAQGKIVAEQATSVVQPLETAIVRSINVREGQSVKKGDLLARLDPTFAVADATALTSSVASLQLEVDRLTAEATSTQFSPRDAGPMALLQTAIFTQRRSERAFKMEGFTQKISSLQTQIARAMADTAAYTERLKLAQNVEGKRKELADLGVGSQLNLLSAIDLKVESQRLRDTAQAQATQGARDLQALMAERDGYDQSWRSQVIQELTEQSRKLSDAVENLNKAVRRRQLVEMRAEHDAIVLNVARGASVGAVMQPGEQLMSLTPLDAPLEVEMNVAGNDAAFVQPGNTVTVKLDSLPFTSYGYLEGAVRIVSPDSFVSNPEQPARGVQQSTPAAASGQAFYRGRVTIDENKLHDTPAGFRLVPGMPVVADVKVGKRTVLSYLFSRVLPVAMDGMREP